MELKDYKKISNLCCVYQIKNKLNNKSYIGSTINLHNRIIRHLWYLKHNIHHSPKLQQSFNKYGIENFEVNILCELEKNKHIQILEEEYIKMLESVDKGYNILSTTKPSSYGFKLSEEQKRKAIQKSCKKVIAFDRYSGEKIREFDSVRQAATFFNTSTSNISRVCKGDLNYMKDAVFRYFDNVDFKNRSYPNEFNTGIPKSEKTKVKMIESNPFSNPVYQYDLNMNLINEYLSRNQCIKITNFGEYKIRMAIKYKTPLNGYYFIQKNKI